MGILCRPAAFAAWTKGTRIQIRDSHGERGVMNRFKSTAVVRGSAVVVGLVTLVSVVGAGVKWTW